MLHKQSSYQKFSHHNVMIKTDQQERTIALVCVQICMGELILLCLLRCNNWSICYYSCAVNQDNSVALIMPFHVIQSNGRITSPNSFRLDW